MEQNFNLNRYNYQKKKNKISLYLHNSPLNGIKRKYGVKIYINYT